MSDLEVMSNVLKNEAEAIIALSETLNETHKKVLDLCYTCKGKIILLGMGKSGHIARKISATLASLGTPSFYIHPGEAAHGDLGKIEKEDIVIMISKSGETDELKQLIPSLKIIGVTIVGIFCKHNSTLEKYCTFTVVLPIHKEACICNLAPTTSTTMTMAFGDALAVALSQKKNFGKNEFALFHPQGSLGKQLLLTAYEISNKALDEIAVKHEDSIKTVLWNITKNRLGAVSVIDDGKGLVGLITDGDIRRTIEGGNDILEKNAYEIMRQSPIYVSDKTLAVDAFKIMNEKKIAVLPIVDDDCRLKGMVSFHDIVSIGIGE